MMECKRVENLVDAFVDGELDAVHAAEMETHVGDCARCARVVAGRRQLRTALKEVLPRYEMPGELRARVKELGRAAGDEGVARPQAFTVARWLRRAIAAGLLIAMGAFSMVLLRPSAAGLPVDAQLASAVEADHVRSLQVDHLVDVVSSEHHTVKPWFGGKLSFSPPVVELSGEFELVGGRVEVVEGREAAALVYRHGGHVMNLLMWPEKGLKEGEFAAMKTARGFNVVKWGTEGGMACWAISDMDAAEMMRFAKAFYDGMEKG